MQKKFMKNPSNPFQFSLWLQHDSYIKIKTWSLWGIRMYMWTCCINATQLNTIKMIKINLNDIFMLLILPHIHTWIVEFFIFFHSFHIFWCELCEDFLCRFDMTPPHNCRHLNSFLVLIHISLSSLPFSSPTNIHCCLFSI